MTLTKATNIVKCGVMPGEIDSVLLAEAKGFIECHEKVLALINQDFFEDAQIKELKKRLMEI